MAEDAKTSIERLLDSHLKGLLLPEKQPTHDANFWFYGVLAILLFIISLAIWRMYKMRRSPQRIALRNIKKLHKRLPLGERPQQLAIQLSRFLRQGLGVSRLDDFSMHFVSESGIENTSENNEWQAFINKLEAASYSKTASPYDEMEKLFEQSYQWLKR